MTDSAPTYTASLTLGGIRPFWMPMIVERCDDGGELTSMRFDLQVKDVGRKAWRAMMLEVEELMAAAELDDDKAEEAVAQLLERVVKGWRHVYGPGGQPISFSAETFRLLLDIQGMAVAIVQAYDNSCPRAVPGVPVEA